MKSAVLKFLTLVLATLAFSATIVDTADARGRSGSHRAGGYNSHGKGSHYYGGH